MVPTVPVLEQDATSVPVEPDLLAPRRQHLACHVGHTGSTGEHPWLPIDDAHRAQEELHHEHARQKKRPAMDLSAGVGQQLNPTSSQAEWRSAAEELARAGVWVALVSLVRHATAHWIAYTVHRTTVERFCLLISAVVISSCSCLALVCPHKPLPNCLPELGILRRVGQNYALVGWSSSLVSRHFPSVQALLRAPRAWPVISTGEEQHRTAMETTWASGLDGGGDGPCCMPPGGLTFDAVLRTRHALEMGSGLCAVNVNYDSLVPSGPRLA